MNRFKKTGIIFLFGFFIYIGLEILWGTLTMPTMSKPFIGLTVMGLLGGFLLINYIWLPGVQEVFLLNQNGQTIDRYW